MLGWNAECSAASGGRRHYCTRRAGVEYAGCCRLVLLLVWILVIWLLIGFVDGKIGRMVFDVIKDMV